MTGIETLLLSSIIAASPTVPTPWFEMDDYPVRAFQRHQQGTTVFEVLVSPDGKPAQCQVTKSSGHYILDEKACAVTMNRIRFTPALESTGRPTYGVYTSRVNWALDPEQWSQSEVGPDFDVSVNKLPDGATAPVSIKYAVLVDASGKPVECRAITIGHGDALNELGCAKIRQDYQRAVTSKSGSALSAVRTSWITFSQ